MLSALIGGRHHAPHHCLGLRREDGHALLRAWLPGARTAFVEPGAHRMRRIDAHGLFEWDIAGEELPGDYRLRWIGPRGDEHSARDPYAFAPELDRDELDRFNAGVHRRAWRLLGAHVLERRGVAGTRFAVWAPNAERVSVVGDFNGWNGRRHPMTARGSSGVWELFVPDVAPGTLYKFEVRHRDSGQVLLKTDPYGRAFEQRPGTAARVVAPSGYRWRDAAWMACRPDWAHAPMAVYEMHLGSWRRGEDGGFLGYAEIAEALVRHLAGSGFTHVELLPVTEHPLDDSWGYQSTGFFAPTSRHGTPDAFRAFVDTLHGHGLGVILDWVPGHFPRDDWALAQFDGTALYEHADPQRAATPHWGSLKFNLARHEVRSFLISSALYWLQEFHLDGLRVDAVASMLYLDYGREAGGWIPNAHGGHEDLDAVAFLRDLNAAVQEECPRAAVVAEESSAWPGVTRPAWLGGLGFTMKWNMGWMHDTLAYFAHDPVHRRYHHDQLTFSRMYAFEENFVLPLSHDEVVHCKGSLLGKMPGDRWQRFANLRLLLAYLFTWPGKKLLFMGQEHAASSEWDFARALDWAEAAAPEHAGIRRLVDDLSRLYRERPALHRHDFDDAGFEWIDCHDALQSVVGYLRRGDGQTVAVALNFTPVPRHGYRIGLPAGGRYRELLNTDSRHYGGGDVGNGGAVEATPDAWMGRAWSASLTLPPLAALLLAPEARA
ncbi:MAG: 1,4-alpha-glucan branching protein GlgB [Mizugakiibacter sp.]|uniref:1,4-alpha-glucan branching protein GlgB n=1 Tax=Mizugakiibacter sp. TaxID=1972610 RepID=UPI0031BC8485|nr:1,4-alpha-glucan branching protein GlgB [Xanthomonadaceae bacterium]